MKAGPPTRGCANLAQDMRIWKGIILVALGITPPLRNGLRYTVVKLPPTDNDVYMVQNVNDRGDLVGEVLSINTDRMAMSLRLSHAICYFSSQARTITGDLRLAQTSHPHFNIRHLVVGLGRAPEGHCVEVE